MLRCWVGRRVRTTPQPPYCAETYASISATCPECTFRDAGCYAQAGFTGHLVRSLDRAATDVGADNAAAEEAGLLDLAQNAGPIPQDGARGGRDLRLHASGDVRTSAGASSLGAAASRWVARGGGAVWTYTHAWRQVPRAAWGAVINVLASVEHPSDVWQAHRRGYAAAIVVPSHPSERAYSLGGVTVVPCPYETRSVTCVRCRLCLNADGLRDRGTAIGFAVHGQHHKRAQRQLQVVR